MRLARSMILVGSVVLASFTACSAQVDTPAGSAPASSTPSKLSADPASCTNGVLGDGSCVDFSVFKLQAGGDLCGDGLSLTDFQIDPGACGDSQAAHATYTCCPTPPGEPPPNKDPGGGSACVAETLSGACQDMAALQAQAEDTCSAAGLSVTPMKLGGACPDGQASDAMFYCCAVPDPATCADSTIGSGVCQDGVDLKMALTGDLCPTGKVATNVEFETGGCPDGQALDVKITCCDPPSLP